MHGLWRTSEKLSGAADEALHLRLELEIAKISFQKIGEFSNGLLTEGRTSSSLESKLIILKIRESSFNMTRGGEDVKGASENF